MIPNPCIKVSSWILLKVRIANSPRHIRRSMSTSMNSVLNHHVTKIMRDRRVAVVLRKRSGTPMSITQPGWWSTQGPMVLGRRHVPAQASGDRVSPVMTTK